MQLDKSSWIVRIAYVFTQQNELPAQVDRCTLWQRFCTLFVPWLLLNIGVWIVGGLLLGIIGQPVCRFIVFMGIGKKLKYNAPYKGVWSIVYARQLTKLCVIYYSTENVIWLNPIRDRDGFFSPFLALLGVSLVALLLTLFVLIIPELVQEISAVAKRTGEVVYNTSGWWGSALATTLSIGLVWYLMRRGYRAFASTPSGTVVVSHLKEWKQQHCTIIELV